MKETYRSIPASLPVVLLMLFCATSCAPKIRSSLTHKYPPLSHHQKVAVYRKSAPLPEQSELLGQVSVGDAGMTTRCSYFEVLDIIMDNARKAGGNAIRIVEHRVPDFMSTCHRIKADVLRVDLESQVALQPNDLADFSGNSQDVIPVDFLGEKKTAPVFDKWRFGVQGGYAYRTGKISNQLPAAYRDYLKKLKSGYTIGGDLHYFSVETLGFGLRYDYNRSKNSLSGANGIEEDISMHYFGASMLNRYIMQGGKASFLLGINMGAQTYRDDALLSGARKVITGSNLGLGMETGVDFKLSPGAALHIGASFLMSNLRKIKVDHGTHQESIELDKDDMENLSRFQLTLGLKFGGKAQRTQ